MSGAHKTLSPSSATRRRLCRGSLAACKGEKNVNTVYAAEGTAYHHVASETLTALTKRGGAACEHWIGLYVHVTPDTCYSGLPSKQPGDEFVFKIDADNAEHAQSYVDAMLRRKSVSSHVRQLYEVKLDTSDVVGVPGQGGTGDCLTLDFENLTIYVDDLKFGKGKQVFASWTDETGKKRPNDQCAWYGAAALRMLRCIAPWKKIVLGIHMPRLKFTDEFEMSVEELDAWVAEHRVYEQQAHTLWERGTDAEIMANLTATKEGCTFCPLDRKCKAQLDAAMNAFPLIQQPDGPNEARRQMWKSTDAEFVRVLNIAEEYESFFSDVFSEGLRRIQAGATLPGWKQILGNKGRRALNTAAAVEFNGSKHVVLDLIESHVGADAFEPAEIKSAAELDKTLNKKRHPDYEVRKALWEALQPAITQPDGQPKLVRENAPGAPYERKPALEFGTIPNQ